MTKQNWPADSVERRKVAVGDVANVAVGYGVSVAATLAILPAFGLAPSPRDALGISAAFTAVSLARIHALRRVFNLIGR